MFAKKNGDRLLTFWNEGLYWADKEVTQLKRSLKLSRNEIDESRTLELVWKNWENSHDFS